MPYNTEPQPTPIADAYQQRYDAIDKFLHYNIKELRTGDFIGFKNNGSNHITSGFVKKICRINIIIETFYQLGAAGYDDGKILELKYLKSQIIGFAHPKQLLLTEKIAA